MSEEINQDMNKTQEELAPIAERESMDGGFAVVDRERLIEEETREVTPWYKHFIHLFTAPQKMMEELFYSEPPKGISIAIVGTILFGLIYMMLTMINPASKEAIYEQFRMTGVAEESMSQLYQISMITGSIGAIVGFFIGGFLSAVMLQILKLIAKDKGKFGALFKVVLFAQIVSVAVLCIDVTIGGFLGFQSTTQIFGIGILLGEEAVAGNILLQAVASVITLANVISVIWMIIGYRAATGASTKKSVIIMVIYQIIMFGVQYGILMGTQSLTQSMMMMGA